MAPRLAGEARSSEGRRRSEFRNDWRPAHRSRLRLRPLTLKIGRIKPSKSKQFCWVLPGRALAYLEAPRPRMDRIGRAASIADSVKWSHYPACPTSPPHRFARLSRPRFARRAIYSCTCATTIMARGPRSPGRGPNGSTGRSTGSTRSSQAASIGPRTALKVIGERVETRTFAELSQESSRLAIGLRALGAKRGDRLVMMLGVVPELWATMLACDEARPRHDPGDAATRRGRHRRPARARQRQISRRRMGPTPGNSSGLAENDRAHRGRRDAARLAELRRALERRRALRARRPDQSRRPDAPLLHLGHDRAREARRAYPCELPDRASHRPCMGSASSPATRISTFPRPAGPSTPGRASLRPGTRAHR